MKKLKYELASISVFRNVLKTKTMRLFVEFLSLQEDNLQQKLNLFADFVDSLSEYNYCFSDFLRNQIFSDENNYVVSVAKGKSISSFIEKNVKKELEIFSKLTELNTEELCSALKFDGYIPQFENKKTDLVKVYFDRIKNISKYGYGIFAMSGMFHVSNDNEIVPVKSADKISIENFIGYREERKDVFDNTKALCEGKPAANILLYGDAGTGKSSTVKACANYFYDKGLRLIEIRKDQLFALPIIMGKIADNPLKFVIFIDDLSFNKNDDNFSMLKAALEGSASAKAKNAVIYATSNRRHIVKESFSDRDNGDDIHHNDTIQELTSLSDRFGMTVYFEKPNKELYLDIVHNLAKRNNINLDRSELDIQAEAFALAKGSRSPRIAEQFINRYLSKI
ncbi:MAG: ATP-binding protein [Elusimicrobia bacterium]|nr:ATP-binding protein [Elusimicrobiota bacterium]